MSSIIRGNDNFDSQPHTGIASNSGYIRFPSWFPTIGGLTIQWIAAPITSASASVTLALPTPWLIGGWGGVATRNLSGATPPEANDIFSLDVATSLTTVTISRATQPPSNRSFFAILIGR